MIKSIVKIRLMQFYRGLSGAGLLRIIILLGILSVLLVAVYIHTVERPGAYFIMAAALLVIFLIQLSRKDKTFLKCCCNQHKLIYLAEYLLISFPIFLVLLLNKQWHVFIIYLASVFAIIQIDTTPKHKSLNSKFQRLIPSKAFEWKAGIRKTLFAVIFVWLIALCTSFFVASVPVGMFFIGIIVLSFYEMCEPWQMIILYEKKPESFLWDKIKSHIMLFSVLTIPLIIAFVIFHQPIWYIPVIEYLAFVSISTYLIIIKYAFYVSNQKSAATQIYEIIGISGLSIIFLPVIWLLSIYFYFKAYSKLNHYLDDYN